MTKHIFVVEMDEPVETGDTSDMLDLSEAMQDLLAAFRAEAQANGGPGAWGAVRALETACYYVHGAAGWLAKDEGLIPS